MEMLDQIREAVRQENYALRPHVIAHMLSDGFDEEEILEAIEDGRILDVYDEECRRLIDGQFHWWENVREHSHVVVDDWSERGRIDWVDIVTAYIPRRPFWETPHRRGTR